MISDLFTSVMSEVLTHIFNLPSNHYEITKLLLYSYYESGTGFVQNLYN